MEQDVKTSWGVIRDSFMQAGPGSRPGGNTRPNTIGYQKNMVAASDLFLKLLEQLKDGEKALEEWKIEPGLVEALANRSIVSKS
jgi:hypothetical protein